MRKYNKMYIILKMHKSAVKINGTGHDYHFKGSLI